MTSSHSHSTTPTQQPDTAKTPAQWLLNGLQTGDLFYTSPTIQYRADASTLALRHHGIVSRELIASLFSQARQQGVEEPLLFGLVPFDLKEAASFTIPSRYESAAVPEASPVRRSNKPGPAITQRNPVPAPEHYGDAVRTALHLYEQNKAEKIVLARALDVTLDGPLAHEPVLQDLIARNRHGYTFAIPAWNDQGDKAEGIMLGASPELLVRREGDRVFINPLAGSIGRHADPKIDQERRDGLAVSEKDLREHRYVVDDIVSILRPYCDELNIPDGPSVIGTDALWHLSTFITGRLSDPTTTALELSCALHPTPAICGQPTAEAFKYIQELEAFDRRYFAGLVGWQKENGDGEWALTLRCAFHTADNRLRLYAGAGTVAGSDPESEILETATKMETFMRAIV